MKPFALMALLFTASVSFAQTVIVTGGKKDAANVIARAKLPKEAKESLNFVSEEGFHGPAEISPIGLSNSGDKTKYFTFLLPKLKAGETRELKTDFNPGPMSTDLSTAMQYRFEEKKGEYIDLVKDNNSLLRFVNKPHDEKDHYLTFKPFHQVFDPTDGKQLISSGAHPDTKEVLYPHHRGIFYGFNKISYGTPDGKTLKPDIWHGTNKVYSNCDKVTFDKAHAAFGRHTAEISWHGPDGKTFADERREVTAFATENGTLIDWVSVLSTELDSVKLDGDPQHAGFHFRAHQDVAMKTKAKTYYIRPDGIGKPGETRNWDADEKKRDANTTDLPWDACSFELDGQRYTALRIAHPGNPKGTRGSERDYGRFGDYFEFELTPKKSLTLQYRIWVQRGAMKVEECEEMARGFTEAPKVEVKK